MEDENRKFNKHFNLERLRRMKKEKFHKKWHYRLLQVIFVVSFIFFILLCIGRILYYDDDIPLMAGFFWAGIVAISYWIINIIYKKIYYSHKNK